MSIGIYYRISPFWFLLSVNIDVLEELVCVHTLAGAAEGPLCRSPSSSPHTYQTEVGKYSCSCKPPHPPASRWKKLWKIWEAAIETQSITDDSRESEFIFLNAWQDGEGVQKKRNEKIPCLLPCMVCRCFKANMRVWEAGQFFIAWQLHCSPWISCRLYSDVWISNQPQSTNPTATLLMRPAYSC